MRANYVQFRDSELEFLYYIYEFESGYGKMI